MLYQQLREAAEGLRAQRLKKTAMVGLHETTCKRGHRIHVSRFLFYMSPHAHGCSSRYASTAERRA